MSSWEMTSSIIFHVFSASMLFAAIFASIPWLSWYDKFTDSCIVGSGRCVAYYKCGSCVVAGFVLIIIAFLILITRLLVWLTPVDFKYKTRKCALIVDVVVILLVFIAALLCTVGGSGTYTREISENILFATDFTVWFAFLGLIIAIIIDVLEARSHHT